MYGKAWINRLALTVMLGIGHGAVFEAQAADALFYPSPAKPAPVPFVPDDRQPRLGNPQVAPSGEIAPFIEAPKPPAPAPFIPADGSPIPPNASDQFPNAAVKPLQLGEAPAHQRFWGKGIIEWEKDPQGWAHKVAGQLLHDELKEATDASPNNANFEAAIMEIGNGYSMLFAYIESSIWCGSEGCQTWGYLKGPGFSQWKPVWDAYMYPGARLLIDPQGREFPDIVTESRRGAGIRKVWDTGTQRYDDAKKQVSRPAGKIFVQDIGGGEVRALLNSVDYIAAKRIDQYNISIQTFLGGKVSNPLVMNKKVHEINFAYDVNLSDGSIMHRGSTINFINRADGHGSLSVNIYTKSIGDGAPKLANLITW